VLIRISIGNLAPRLIVKETGAVRFFGVLNSASFRKGHKRIGALGGAAELTQLGKEYLENNFEAHDFEGMDARFVVDDSHLETIFEIFSRRDPDFFEIDPAREIMEEFVREKILSFGPILTAEEASGITFRFVKTLEQKAGGGTSAREKEGMSTRRLFHFFDIEAPQLVLFKMSLHATLHLLTEEEVATTEGGSKKGITSGGTEIADNIFW